ncbi:hypothetical protein [Microbacterium sp. ZOR0019]|uniref:hypothetical protein n=1 Tax=Microbacterium sp. ZOR0019 TaxID=1339233 RepID=UPI000648D19C|nr:hypothetical protein [Microbacterium sp. ZOR0019]
MSTLTPEQIADQAVLSILGPTADADLYAMAVSDVNGGVPTSDDLLNAAAWYRDLDGRGVHKLMAAAVAIDRAQRA